MKPIRVLQVVTIMNCGGLETMLMNYYRKIDRNKIQFDFMTHREERGYYDDEIEKMGGRIYRMSSIRPGNYNKYFKKLDEFFNQHKEYKIVHSHINENSGFVLKAANKANIKCRIAHNHIAGLGVDYKLPFRLYARTKLKGNISEYFACSDEAAKWLFGKNIFLKEKVKILNNAVDTSIFNYDEKVRNKIKSQLGIKNKIVLGHVGRFNSSKNHKFLLDVFSDIYKTNQNFELLLIGDGKLKKKMEQRAKELKIDKAVKFLGIRKDISELMQAMDIFIFPSFFEALPVVLIEAQATGLKCIVSTGVPREVNISNNIEFLDLNYGKKIWSEKIKNIKYERKYNRENIINSGYDIEENVRWLTEFYLTKNKVMGCGV